MSKVILPPHSDEQERAVLACLLLEPETIPVILEQADAADFYSERHQAMFRASVDLYNESSLTYATLVDELARRGELMPHDDSYLTGIVNDLATTVHAAHHAQRVHEYAGWRRLIAAAERIVQVAYKPEGVKLADACATAAQQIERVMDDGGPADVLEWENAFDQWCAGQEERDRLYRSKAPRCDLPWRSLSWVRPIRPGMLALVAADTGIGKTIFGENCAEHWARGGFSVAYFHFELEDQIMSDRRLVRYSGESMDLIEQGEITPAILQAQDGISHWRGRITYVFCDGWPMSRVAAKARALARQGKADVVIVDYLQKAPLREYVRGVNPAQMRARDVEILKSLGERGKLRVLLLSQINREEARATRKTRKGIRDTGEAAEKANLVITLDREILEHDRMFGGHIARAGEYSPEITVRVDKQTLGGTGEKKLLMNPARFMMADMAEA